ncbi:Hypothetical protein NocV09_08200070 [Nannochloropsis oceanica]
MHQQAPSLLLVAVLLLSHVSAFHLPLIGRRPLPLSSSTLISAPPSPSGKSTVEKPDPVQVLEYLRSFLAASSSSSSSSSPSSSSPSSIPHSLDPSLPPDVKTALADILTTVQAREEEGREAGRQEGVVKEWKMKAFRLENELQATRRNMKEIENIRRDMAYRLKQAQTTAEEGRKGSEEKMERMERELEEGRKGLKMLQEKEQEMASLLSILSSASDPPGKAAKCFGEIERKMQGVEGGALAAVEAMKEETRRMEGCVRMAEEGAKRAEQEASARVLAAQAEVDRREKELEEARQALEEQASARVVAARADVARMEEEVKEWQKAASQEAMEREAIVEQAQLLQSLYDEETARFEAGMRKMVRMVKDEAAASQAKEATARAETTQLVREYTLALEARDALLAAWAEKEAAWGEEREGWGAERARGEAALLEAMKVVERLEREVEVKGHENAAWARKTQEKQQRIKELLASLASLESAKQEAVTEADRLLSVTQEEHVHAAARWQAEVASARVQARADVEAAATRERNALIMVSSAREQNQQLSEEVAHLRQSLGLMHAGQGSVRALLRLMVRRVVENVTGRVRQIRGGGREEGKRRRRLALGGVEQDGRWEGLEELVPVYEGEKEGVMVGA